METVFYWIIAAVWLLGWLQQVAEINAIKDRQKIVWPFVGAREAVWLVMLFTWPYWYFYGKAR